MSDKVVYSRDSTHDFKDDHFGYHLIINGFSDKIMVEDTQDVEKLSQ